MVEAGYSKAYLGEIGRWIKANQVDKLKRTMRDQGGDLGEGERHPTVTVHLYTLAVLLLYPSSLNIFSYP